MMERIAGASPCFKARIADGLCLLIFVTGAVANTFVDDKACCIRGAAAIATKLSFPHYAI